MPGSHVQVVGTYLPDCRSKSSGKHGGLLLSADVKAARLLLVTHDGCNHMSLQQYTYEAIWLSLLERQRKGRGKAWSHTGKPSDIVGPANCTGRPKWCTRQDKTADRQRQVIWKGKAKVSERQAKLP